MDDVAIRDMTGSQSVDRATKLLSLVGRQADGMTLSAVVEKSGLNKPTVRRLLLALIRAGLLEQDDRDRRYYIGEEAYVLGTLASGRHGLLRLSTESLHRLAQKTSDSCFLSVRRGASSVCLHREEGSFPIRTHALQAGSVHPLGVGAGSLAMLSALPDEEVSAVLEQNAAVLENQFPMLAPDELRRRVELTRIQGYAVNPGLILANSWGGGRRDPLSGRRRGWSRQHCRHRQPHAGAATERAGGPSQTGSITHRDQARRAVPRQADATHCSRCKTSQKEIAQMTEAQIVGWAHSQFGKTDYPDTEALMAAVAAPALAHAGVAASDIDGIFVGVMNGGFSKQEFQAALVGMADEALAHVPSVRLENACATGSAAIYTAMDFIEAGRGRIALVIGAEKMTAVPTAQVGDILLGGSYRKEEGDVEGGFAGVFGRIAQHYFQRYGDRSEELAMIAAKNHANGVANPYAHMRRDFGFSFCNTVSEKNPIVAAPLRRTDCSLVSDGAAALVLAAAETAATLQRAVAFRARSHVNDVFALSRRDMAEFDGPRRAWKAALSQAAVTLEDLSFVETHDCFTIAEMIEYEAMGLTAPGEGYRAIRDGTTTRSGRLPVNPSGGLKSKGHPIGATGVSMHVISAMQLMGEAGEMQIPHAGLAGIFNMGGAAVANYVSILERVK